MFSSVTPRTPLETIDEGIPTVVGPAVGPVTVVETVTEPATGASVSLPWVPCELEPAEVITIVNVLSNGCKRGAFNIEEFELLTPLHRRLLSHLVKYHDIDATAIPPPAVTTTTISAKRSTTAAKNNKKKHKRG